MKSIIIACKCRVPRLPRWSEQSERTEGSSARERSKLIPEPNVSAQSCKTKHCKLNRHRHKKIECVAKSSISMYSPISRLRNTWNCHRHQQVQPTRYFSIDSITNNFFFTMNETHLTPNSNSQTKQYLKEKCLLSRKMATNTTCKQPDNASAPKESQVQAAFCFHRWEIIFHTSRISLDKFHQTRTNISKLDQQKVQTEKITIAWKQLCFY